MSQTPSEVSLFSRKSFWLLVILVAVVFLPVMRDLVFRWYDDPNYSHGFLVPLIAAYLIWRNRTELKQPPVKSNPVGLVVAVMGFGLFILANAGFEYFLVALSMVIVIFGLTLYLLGTELIRRIWFAFFILLFMIPIPGVVYFSLTFPMQLLASKISVGAMQALGMSVVRSGNVMILPNQSLEVAEACSGLRSLISLMAMGAFYGYLTQPRLSGKAIVFLSSIPIAVFSNIIRVFVTAMIAYVMDIDPTIEPLHTILGLSVFVVSFILLSLVSFIVRIFFK